MEAFGKKRAGAVVAEVFEVWSGVEGRVASGSDRATASLELARSLRRAITVNRGSLFNDSCEIIVTWGQEDCLRKVIRRITVRGGKVESDIIAPGDWQWEHHGGPAQHMGEAVDA